VLKMYHRHGEAGGSPAYWEEFGGGSALADHLRFCEVDPLAPLFRRVLKPGAVMLEGGCGRGQYVAYYGARGVTVIGLDFAREWLKAAHTEIPSLRLCAGDVGALPFPDHCFDVYYSGGVVEHFERGADRALAEARRVLKHDGVLLLSVPYFSPLRRVIAAVGRDTWRRVAKPAVDDRANDGLRFHQYAYTVQEFTDLLTAAGFTVIGTQGYAVVWGLYDIGVIQRIATWIERRRAGTHRTALPRAAHATGAAPANGQPSLLKRLVVSEDDTVPVAGWAVRAARQLCANMMMYVCMPAASPMRQAA
jgi:SAM-dependent methyltransferase